MTRPRGARDYRLSAEGNDHKAGGKQQESVRSDTAVVSQPDGKAGKEAGAICVHTGGDDKNSCENEKAFSKGLVWEGNSNFAHAIEFDTIAKGLDVNLQHGLSTAEAASRLARDGPNKLEEDEGVSIWEVLLRQVSNSLTMVSTPVLALRYRFSVIQPTTWPYPEFRVRLRDW